MTIPLLLLSALLVFALTWTFLRRRRFKVVTGGIDKRITLEHTESVELYSNSFSHCSRKVRLVLSELGIEAKHHSIDLIETGSYQTVSTEYLKVNPAGLVPTLLHNGHPVFESDDILTYAQTIAPADAPKLIPDDPLLQEQMHQWLDFCAIVSADLFGGMKDRAGACIPGLTMPMFIASIQYVSLRKILAGFLRHHTFKSPTMFTVFRLFGLRRMVKIKPFREFVHVSRDHMGEHLETINQSLMKHGQPWILGQSYSLADVTIGAMLLRLDEAGWLHWFDQSLNIQGVMRYYQRLKARPSWGAAIAAHEHAIVARATNDLIRIVQKDPALAAVLYGPVVPSAPGNKEAHSW